MKKLVILLVYLILLIMPAGFSRVIDIPSVSVSDGQLREIYSEGTTYYVVFEGGILASVKSGEVIYYHKDRLGSNIRTSNGEVKGSKTLPFGQSLENDGIRQTFTGKEPDSSGLYYFNARYYDSDLGRFMSTDPVMDGLTYAYVNNNPLKYVDPTGMRQKTATYREETFDSSVWDESNLFFMGDIHSEMDRRETVVELMESGQVTHLGLEMLPPSLDSLAQQYVAGEEGDYAPLKEYFKEKWEDDYGIPEGTFMNMLDVAREEGVAVFGIENYAAMGDIIRSQRSQMEEGDNMLIFVGFAHVVQIGDRVDPQQYNLANLMGGVYLSLSRDNRELVVMRQNRDPTETRRLLDYKSLVRETD